MYARLDKKQVELSSERLTLRPLKQDDVSPSYVGWLSDNEVNQFMETRHIEQTEQAIREFVDKQYSAQDTYLFGMFLKPSGQHIGNIKIGPVKSNHSVADISLFVGEKTCWGKGFASEAIRSVAEFGLKQLRLNKVSAVAYSVNQGSVRAFLNAGFKQEGLRRKHYVLNGEAADVTEVGMVLEDLGE